MYKRLNIKAAPGKATKNSDQTLVVSIYNNADLLKQMTVRYGEYDELKAVDISGVSALNLRVTLDTKVCSSKSMFAVLYDIAVS